MFPNLTGTDLHTNSINGYIIYKLNVLFIHLAIDIFPVIFRSIWESTKVNKYEYFGYLFDVAIADVTIFGLRRDDFGFQGIAYNRLNGTNKPKREMTIKDGRIVYNLNRIA